jgi:hypothetical protein
MVRRDPCSISAILSNPYSKDLIAIFGSPRYSYIRQVLRLTKILS